jgi:hypothetical protein
MNVMSERTRKGHSDPTEREKLKWQQGDDTTGHALTIGRLGAWKYINNLSPPDSFNSSEPLAKVYARRLVLLHVDASTCPIQNIYHTVLRGNERLDTTLILKADVTTEERRYRVYISCTRFPSRLFDGKWCLSTKELLHNTLYDTGKTVPKAQCAVIISFEPPLTGIRELTSSMSSIDRSPCVLA